MIAKRHKVTLDWEEIERLIEILCENIVTKIPTIDSVLGIPRGGLIPAVLISHRLELPLVTLPEPHTLVVDDIADSGKTLSNAPGIYTGVLHYKSHTSKFKPDYSVDYLKDSPWIHMPFEKYETTNIKDFKFE